MYISICIFTFDTLISICICVDMCTHMPRILFYLTVCTIHPLTRSFGYLNRIPNTLCEFFVLQDLDHMLVEVLVAAMQSAWNQQGLKTNDAMVCLTWETHGNLYFKLTKCTHISIYFSIYR